MPYKKILLFFVSCLFFSSLQVAANMSKDRRDKRRHVSIGLGGIVEGQQREAKEQLREKRKQEAIGIKEERIRIERERREAASIRLKQLETRRLMEQRREEAGNFRTNRRDREEAGWLAPVRKLEREAAEQQREAEARRTEQQQENGLLNVVRGETESESATGLWPTKNSRRRRLSQPRTVDWIEMQRREEQQEQTVREQATQEVETEVRVAAPEEPDEPVSGNPCTDKEKFPKVDDLSKDQLDELIEELEIFKNGFLSSPTSIVGPQGVFATSDRRMEDRRQASICQSKIRTYRNALGVFDKCEEAIKEMKKKKSDFVRDCGEFSSGRMRCSVAIMACKMCPSQADFGDYDCVKIHDRTNCPAKSGEELKAAKENRDQNQENKDELEEAIGELEQDIVSKQADLNESLAELEEEFMSLDKELKRNVEDQQAELNDQLLANEGAISEALTKALSEVQQEIDKSLAISHSFENATYKANKEYRTERRQIALECEAQARSRLAKYRKKRRAAIRTGSLQISLSDLLKEGRISFAQTEKLLFRQYNSECLFGRREDFNEVEMEYKQKLRVIEQQREQYLARMESLRKQITSLHEQAKHSERSLIEQYQKSMDRLLRTYDEEYRSASESYHNSQNTLLAGGKKITLLQKQLAELRYLLRENKVELVREEAMIAYLKSKGVVEDAGTDQYSEAAASFVGYYDAIDNAEANCSEGDKEIKTARSHIERDSSQYMLKSFFGIEEEDEEEGDR